VVLTSHRLRETWNKVVADLDTIEVGGKLIGAYVVPHWTGGAVTLRKATTLLH
jgi:hypothetical protein